MFLCTVGVGLPSQNWKPFANMLQAYPSTPIGSTWTVSNIPNLNARAMTSGLYISFGNCAGLLSSNIYHEWEAPRYQSSLSTNIGMSIALIAVSISYGLWMRWENRRRDRAADGLHGGQPTEGITSTRDPRFRFQT